ncbi:Adenylate kinase isoenzyme 1 [Sarcoptes scabiei]|uniref:adenylate kinase n=1 Tax=Sarcoptes scabiei TaxID=52283 RepID=A0A131ZUS3_SARSC|nr:Adenylate kinase isoenzyme 1 [Sarcoptes scabiei]KPM02548.1 adenylate kinase isoenzyme 1-like protein [Sarcoptes scabiei]UXI14465.1 hypothetical protein NH340_JMT00408 [Sarcoptes scabiei]
MAPITDILDRKPIIFVIGGPGSGKGTCCARLKEKYGLTHLSTGDLLRDEVASGSALGQELNSIMQSGKLVSNKQVLDLLEAAIRKQMSVSKGFLIDGYPREANQAVEFEKQIGPCKTVLYFKCSDSAMIERLINRGKFSGRVDDNEETIKKRLKVFHENSDPILKYLKEKVVEFDSNKTVDDLFADVDEFIRKLLNL